MSWTPLEFSEEADRQYAGAQSYVPSGGPDVNRDLQSVLRAVASAQEAAREVIRELAANPSGLEAGQFPFAESYLGTVELSTQKLRDGLEYLKLLI